jgi:hypothetical protein
MGLVLHARPANLIKNAIKMLKHEDLFASSALMCGEHLIKRTVPLTRAIKWLIRWLCCAREFNQRVTNYKIHTHIHRVVSVHKHRTHISRGAHSFCLEYFSTIYSLILSLSLSLLLNRRLVLHLLREMFHTHTAADRATRGVSEWVFGVAVRCVKQTAPLKKKSNFSAWQLINKCFLGRKSRNWVVADPTTRPLVFFTLVQRFWEQRPNII